MSDDSPNNFDRLKTGLGGRPPGLDPRADKIKKIIVLNRDSGSVRLDKRQIVIGSVISADLRLVGDGVAPIHAVIERTGEDQVTVYDLASDTGVFVNSNKVVTQVLRNGDIITVGHHHLNFQLEDFDHSSNKIRYRQSEGRNLFMNPSEDFAPLLLEDEREVNEIFDYRPAQLTALEAVMSWHDTVMDVQHFVHEKAVIVGNGKNVAFGLPPVLASARYPLVELGGESYTLNLDDRMKGVVQRKGELKTLDEIRMTAQRGVAGYAIPIQKGDFAKVTIGEVDFYLSFTAAPPRLKMNRLFDRDAFFFKILMSSLLLTTVTVVGLLRAPVQQNIEAEQIPERIATILYQPEKYVQHSRSEQSKLDQAARNLPVQETKPQPKPTPQETTKIDLTPNPKNANKPVPKEMDTGKNAGKGTHITKKTAGNKGQNAAKEGAGAKHSGKEGERGKKSAKDTSAPPQDKARAASPEGGKGAGGGHSQVVDEGNVDILKGATAKIENLLGNSAANLGGGGEKLKGFGGFTTKGNGGLALNGNGAGGGGTSDLSAGLGDKGRGGGKVGTGMGAAGNGAGIIGGQTRVAIRTGGSEEAVVMGAIDADAVEAALLAHKDEFRRCYEAEINAENPNLAGRVGTSFVIGNTGRVTQAGIESTTLKNANAERCILVVIKRIDFPIPRGGGVVQVSYPFKFSATGH